MNNDDFRSGLKEGMPLALSIFAYGLVFGVLARQAGLSYWETVLMSGLVFAGSAQFVAVGMVASEASIGQIVLATLLLNLRHLLMGASLAPYLAKVKPWKLALLAHGLNDEAYALTISRFQRLGGSAAYFFGTGTATFLGWFFSSALAAVAGSLPGDPQHFGLGFAFLGAFIGLLIPQITGWTSWIVSVIAAVTALFAGQTLQGKWYILVAALVAAATGAVIESYANGDTVDYRRDGRSNLPDQG